MQIALAIEQIESKSGRLRRCWMNGRAESGRRPKREPYGWGDVSEVSDATGMSPNTIRKGLAALATRQAAPDAEVTSRVPKTGGGRSRLSETDLQLSEALVHLAPRWRTGIHGGWASPTFALFKNE